MRQKEQEEKLLIEDSIWKGGLKVPSRSGKRLIINHLGSSDGFLQGCGECFVGKNHHITIMNALHFEESKFEGSSYLA